MARLVRAYDRAGDRSACESARDDYLAAYAQGRYANDVRQRCD